MHVEVHNLIAIWVSKKLVDVDATMYVNVGVAVGADVVECGRVQWSVGGGICVGVFVWEAEREGRCVGSCLVCVTVSIRLFLSLCSYMSLCLSLCLSLPLCRCLFLDVNVEVNVTANIVVDVDVDVDTEE